VNYTRDAQGIETVGSRWNSTTVYQRRGGAWKAIHRTGRSRGITTRCISCGSTTCRRAPGTARGGYLGAAPPTRKNIGAAPDAGQRRVHLFRADKLAGAWRSFVRRRRRSAGSYSYEAYLHARSVVHHFGRRHHRRFRSGLSGFAFSLVATSIWAWGVDPKLAASCAIFGGFSGQVMAAFRVRRGFDWSVLLPYLVGAAVGFPIGIALLPLLDVNMFKAILGSMLIIRCPLMLFAKHLPRITRGRRVADGAAGCSAAFAAASAGSPVSSRLCGARCAGWTRTRNAA
jgi:hypothetical protein